MRNIILLVIPHNDKKRKIHRLSEIHLIIFRIETKLNQQHENLITLSIRTKILPNIYLQTSKEAESKDLNPHLNQMDLFVYEKLVCIGIRISCISKVT